MGQGTLKKLGWCSSLQVQKKSLRNSHQNSHSTKIKMAADLTASHLIDFV
jgi:hypothetical protein